MRASADAREGDEGKRGKVCVNSLSFTRWRGNNKAPSHSPVHSSCRGEEKFVSKPRRLRRGLVLEGNFLTEWILKRQGRRSEYHFVVLWGKHVFTYYSIICIIMRNVKRWVFSDFHE